MQYQALHRAFWDTGTFWVTVAVAIFLLLFGRRIVRGVLAAIDARTDGIRGAIAEAQRLRREAEAMLRDAERRQADALDTTRRLTEEAEARARRLTAAFAREAEDTEVRREAMVAARIDAASKAAVKDVRDAATTVAVEAAGRLLREMMNEGEQRRTVDHALQELPGALGPRDRAAA